MTLRHKLVLGFVGPLLIVAALGIHSILQFRDLSGAIDEVLRENYVSILACLEMKESLDRMDSGAAFIVLGRGGEGKVLLSENEPRFGEALDRELRNITLPGEGEKAELLKRLFGEYRSALDAIRSPDAAGAARQDAYFGELLPLSGRIREAADAIQRMNQENMEAMDRRARRQADTAQRRMYVLLLAATVLSAAFLYLVGKWILRPITRLILSAEEIRRGNLDLVVPSGSGDEVGRLSEAFNGMAASLREFRRSDQAKLLRSRRSIQEALNSLPDVIAVLDPDGVVEVSTESAREAFGLRPAVRIQDVPHPCLAELFREAVRNGRPAGPREGSGSGILQRFVRGEERFFRPEAVPIMDPERQPAGVVLVLSDVTVQRHQDEMKSSAISTVSHQLKTPLTSVRMALHLLLEEKVGALNEKQAELLVAAREEADRLDRILAELLDIGRIGSGKVPMELRPVSPQAIVSDGVEPYLSAARDGGLVLAVDLPAGLPAVWADPARITHVFANLLSNALKYTPPGGGVTVSAREEGDHVRFRVADSGIGIPQKYLPQVFEQFFRVPEQGPTSGVGLGLAIVKDIVEAHGGTVGVESREGAGSTFSFSLRRADRASGKGVRG